MSNNKELSVAGTDNRAPMLEENDYESWKIRMKRPKRDEEFTAEENARDLADIQAASILSQVTETIQRKAVGNVSNAGTKGNQGYGKKTDRNGKKYYKDKTMLSDAKDRGVILDAKAEAFLADVECTEPYDESLALTTTTTFQVSHEDAYDYDIDDGPHVAAAFMAKLSSTEEANGISSSKINEYLLLTEAVVPPTEKPSETHNVSLGEMYLQDQITANIPHLEGHIKTNKDLSRANESLKAELTQCKLEMQSLEHNKVKHDLDQAIVDRDKWNTELEKENSLLKTTLFNKEESIKAINEKNNKVVSEKKDFDKRNLEEIVCLQKANRVILLDPTHVPSSIWETEETIALGVESRAKMFEKPRTVKPINYDVLNNSYIKFVPQKELSREQVYWQSASAGKALFVHTRPAKMRTADVRMPLDEEISSICVRELSKGLELEAEIAKKNKMLSESEK
uniref:Uncharacterized protein n=1 Tax=Tanacetum cinerariifolium TaxID=118510 RepID=A0A6L2LDW6_TANCI|nr:hypothetical protein [Tanacetum cinerariifolium]